jgi:DNA modification methylase
MDLGLNTIYTGDARELIKNIADESIDLIFTDPPYLKQFIPLYGFLSEQSNRVLKNNGWLLCYVGPYWKWEVMKLLSKHMEYFWDMISVCKRNAPIMWQKKILSMHKSILTYRKKGSKILPRFFVHSLWEGCRGDKEYHKWGQSESEARYYIDNFSIEGDTILEPFAGGGTTCVVCKMINRNYIAFEIDCKSAEIARNRINGTLLNAKTKQEEMEL